MTGTPAQRYRENLATGGLQYDSAQEEALTQLQNLYDSLVQRNAAAGRPAWYRRVTRLVKRNSESPPRGLYLWGGVGRGKTYLMDIFFESLPFQNKMRTHFHRFMRRVHHELDQLKGRPDPLETVAAKLAREAGVICFDEFFVSDITDAMILGNLLKALFERGVTLVATSNVVPEDLYRDGLQRARFLPAIDLLNRHTQVINVDGGIDYRLRALKQAALYYLSSDQATRQALRECFERLVPDEQNISDHSFIEIERRKIPVVREAEDVVWFEFRAICDGPRSQNDYIEIAREYHAVLIEGVPVFNTGNDDQARRFIFLVDEFYDRNVKLVLSAEKPVTELYPNGRLAFEFQRTVSRIQEMQSTEYLGRGHKA